MGTAIDKRVQSAIEIAGHHDWNLTHRRRFVVTGFGHVDLEAVERLEAHAPRAYPIMSLLEPPLKDTIERFVKSPPAPKRRATAPPAGEGPATRRATAGSLDGFVTTVTGVPWPPPSAR